jgi:ABC-type molybdate transport system substrate-binding protein
MTVEQAQEIKVIASGGLKAACIELIPAFEQASGHRTKTVWAGSPDIMKRMQAGETVDLVIMPGAAIDELIKLGKVVAGSRVDLAKSGIGVAVRAGAPLPADRIGTCAQAGAADREFDCLFDQRERRLYGRAFSAPGHCR